MWLCRGVISRGAGYIRQGSARDVFSFDGKQRVFNNPLRGQHDLALAPSSISFIIIIYFFQSLLFPFFFLTHIEESKRVFKNAFSP
jgi:hypothetical protein